MQLRPFKSNGSGCYCRSIASGYERAARSDMGKHESTDPNPENTIPFRYYNEELFQVMDT